MKHDSECEMYSEACGCESRKQKDAEIAALKELLRLAEEKAEELGMEAAHQLEKVRELEKAITYCIETDKESQAEIQRLREALEKSLRILSIGHTTRERETFAVIKEALEDK